MTNANPNKLGSQMTDMRVMISRCSLHSQHRGNRSESCECWLFLFKVNKDQNSNASERQQRKKTEFGKHKSIICCFLRSNLTQRRYWKNDDWNFGRIHKIQFDLPITCEDDFIERLVFWPWNIKNTWTLKSWRLGLTRQKKYN